MFRLLKNIYLQTEEIKGKKLLYLIAGVFFGFLLLGVFLGYLTNIVLNINERNQENNLTGQENSSTNETSIEGKIKYIDPKLYPVDDISFTLVDNKGKELILLKARDQILSVAENQYVTVYGTKEKTSENKDVLMVDRVSIKNVAN